MNGSDSPAARPTARCSRIAGTGGYLPGQRLTNGALADRLASLGVVTSDDWIVDRTGIRARHFAPDGELCSDLATVAAQRAIEAAGCSIALFNKAGVAMLCIFVKCIL